MFKFVIPRGQSKRIYVDRGMHRMIKLYAEMKETTMQAAVFELIKAGMLADKEFSGPLHKKLKKL